MSSIGATLSLIIAVYDRPDFLEGIFVSLLNQSFGDFEIIVADDGSGPEIADVIAANRDRFRHPLQHIRHPDEGFRKTVIVNKAVTMAAGDYLVFIDGDCFLHHRFLERHERRRKRNRVLSGRRVMMKQSLTMRITMDDIRGRRLERPSFWWKESNPNTRRNGFYLPPAFGLRNRFRDRYSILGSNFSVHREDFLRVNGYDERIVGRGLEDNNLCARFINNKMTLMSISNEAIQYHCFHTSEPPPHKAEFIEQFRSSKETWTEYGIRKGKREENEWSRLLASS